MIGKVDKDLTVRVMVSTDFGTNIGQPLDTSSQESHTDRMPDFGVVDAVVDATHRHSEIYYDKD